MAVPACFILIPHAKREDDDFRIQDEDGHGQALHTAVLAGGLPFPQQ